MESYTTSRLSTDKTPDDMVSIASLVDLLSGAQADEVVVSRGAKGADRMHLVVPGMDGIILL